MFNKHSGSITGSLNLVSWPEDTSMSSGNDKINSTVKKCDFHQSMKAMKKRFKIEKEFSFNHVATLEQQGSICDFCDFRKLSLKNGVII